MFLRLAALFCLILLASINVAQEDTPPITAENATQLVPVQTVGSALPGKLAFSPDDRYILASTSEQTYVYEADQPDAAPKILPFTDFSFDTEDRLVANGHYWNLDTGLSVGIAPTIRVLPPTENQPNTFIEVVKPGGDIIQVDTGFPYQILGTAVSDNYSILAVVMRGPGLNSRQRTLNLYRLPMGTLYAIFPQYSYGSLENLFFIQESTTLISEFYSGQDALGYISIYEAQKGDLFIDYSGRTYDEGQLAPDGKIFSYAINRNKIVILGQELFAQIPYTPSEDGYSSPPLYGVGNDRIAILDGNQIKITDLRDDTVPPVSLAFEETPDRLARFYFAQDDRWLVYLSTPKSYIWDLQTPHLLPREISITEGYSQNLSSDFIRYSVKTPYYESNKLVVLDANTNQLLAELPPNANLNAAMTQALYWQGGEVMLHDIVGGKFFALPVIEHYLGSVEAFNEISAMAAFVDEQLTLVSIPDATLLPVELSSAPDSVDFTADGESFLVYRAYRGENNPPPYLSIWDTDSSKQIKKFTSQNTYGSQVISPGGHYILDDYASNYGCGTAYSSPYLRLFSTVDEDVASPLIHLYGPCGKNTTAFSKDDATFYVGADFNVFAFQPDLLSDPVYGTTYTDSGAEFSILNYSPIVQTETEDNIRGIALSPDQHRIAVIVKIWNNVEFTRSDIRTEIFELDQLKVGTRRNDIRPLATIPGASNATFSPDGNSIVTNVGLFGVGDSTGAKIVDGTISAFTSDSQLLATYQDGYVNIWRVPDPSAITFPLAQYAMKGVKKLIFSPDNRYLYIVREGDVQMWGVK